MDRLGLYAGEVAYVDHYVGKLLDTLRALGYFENSLIVLIADHGHPLADHGKFLKGGDRMYSELLKVPFMMRFPKGAYGGRRLDAVVQFHDVLPTISDALGMGNNKVWTLHRDSGSYLMCAHPKVPVPLCRLSSQSRMWSSRPSSTWGCPSQATALRTRSSWRVRSIMNPCS